MSCPLHRHDLYYAVQQTEYGASAKNGFTNATDAADYLVNHGVPFRDAHGIVGRLVLTCIDKGISLDELPLEEYKAISPVFENDIYEAISMKTCVEKRMTIGAPGPDVMEKVIAENKKISGRKLKKCLQFILVCYSMYKKDRCTQYKDTWIKMSAKG